MSDSPASRLLGRLEALLLVVFGVAALLFARGPDYTSLMSPTFRWVTLAGAALLTLQGLVLLARPRRAPHPSAFAVFALLALLIAVGRPGRAVGGGIVPPEGGPALTREGYAPLLLEDLFFRLSEEVVDVPEGKVVVQGRVHEVHRPDGTVERVLLYPKVACCLADALAYAIRLDLPQGVAVPEGATWVYVFGDLVKPESPVVTAPFRAGAIAYTAVSRNYLLRPEEVLDHRALLEPVTAKIPPVQSAAFLDALRRTGLAAELEGEGPFTVFAPIDTAFLQQVRTLAPADTDTVDAQRLARYLRSFVVPEALDRSALYDRTAVETLGGRRLEVRVENGRPIVEGARILFADQLGRNGVVHIVHPAWPPRTDGAR